MFHALTGSDTVSFFRNRGKKSAWYVWNVFPELTPVLCALKASPEIITEESLAVLERLVVLLYDRTSSLLKVNEARQELFCKKSREFDSIPPTKAALEQHIRRAVLGAKPFCASPHFLALQTRDGSVKHVAGHRIGRLLNKQNTPAMNLSTVDVKLHAGGDASL